MDTLDCSDIDQYLGKPITSTTLREPIANNDIRRWAHAMHYPNLLHYDPDYAAASRWRKLVGPQSFPIVVDDGHGSAPACVGCIPNSHLLFGGDEWWFYGPRVCGGDMLTNERIPFDYVVKETKFAGPTCFQRGDNFYRNQRGELIAKQRSTSIRYRAAAGGATVNMADAEEPVWSDEEIDALEKRKFGWIQMLHDLGHKERWWDEVKVGDQVARARVRSAFGRKLRHRVARLYHQHLGHDEPAQARPARARLHAGDGGLRKRSGRAEGQPGDHRRRLLRSVARPSLPALGAQDRHAARLWLRRLDGRLGDRLSVGLGGRARHGRALRRQLPRPRPVGRHHHPDRGNRRQVGRREGRHIVQVKHKMANQKGTTMATALAEIQLPKKPAG